MYYKLTAFIENFLGAALATGVYVAVTSLLFRMGFHPQANVMAMLSFGLTFAVVALVSSVYFVPTLQSRIVVGLASIFLVVLLVLCVTGFGHLAILTTTAGIVPVIALVSLGVMQGIGSFIVSRLNR